MSTAIESGQGALWQQKQTGAGTIAAPDATGAQAPRALRKATDDSLTPAKAHDMEEYVDGQAFSNPQMYVKEIGGDSGTITNQAQPTIAPFQIAQIIGVDVVTGASDPYTHTMAVGTAGGAYQTFRQKTGVNVGPVRGAWWDALVNTLTWQCGQDQWVAHIAQAVLALQASEAYDTDPTVVDNAEDSYLWSEATGAVTIDTGGGATALPEIEGETLEINRNHDVHRGDGPTVDCFIPGKGLITRTMTTLLTTDVLAIVWQSLYGDTAAPDDATPVNSEVAYVAMETTYTRSASRSLKLTTPKVEVKTDDWDFGPHPEGGKIPVTLGGQCLKPVSGAMLTVVAKTAGSAAYV